MSYQEKLLKGRLTSARDLASELSKDLPYDSQGNYDQQQHLQPYLEPTQDLYLGCLREFLNTKPNSSEIQNPSDSQAEIDIYQLDKVRENLNFSFRQSG